MKDQLKIGAVLTYISLFLANVIALFYTPYMLKVLGQSEFGLYSLANSIVGYLTVLDFGFGSTTIRYVAKYRAENNYQKEHELYGMLIIIYFIIGIITLLIGAFITSNAELFFAQGLNDDEIILVKKLIFIAIANLAISFPFGIFTSIVTAYEKFIFLKVSSIIRFILNPIVLIPTLFFGYRSVGLIVATTVLNIIFLVANLIYCFAKLHIKISFKNYDFKLLKEIIIFSGWVFLASIVQQTLWNSGNFLLGMFSSAAAIGIFSIAMQFRGYFELFSTVVTSVFLPRMTQMTSRNASNKEFSDYFIKISRLQFIFISLITTGFILFGKQFIQLWAGIEYTEAYYVGVILFIPLSLVYTQTLATTILQAKNKHKFNSIVTFICTLSCIILSIPFIHKYNIYACAISLAIALIIGSIFIMNWYYKSRIGLDIKAFWFEILKILPSILISSLISAFILKHAPVCDNYLLLFIYIILYVLLYSVLVYFVSANKYEKNLVKHYFRKLLFWKNN